MPVGALSIVHFWSKAPDASLKHPINKFDLFASSDTEGRTSKGSTATEQEEERWDFDKSKLWQGFIL